MRWAKVTIREVHEILKDAQRAGNLYAGCTQEALCRKYGRDNVMHKIGIGWFKLVAKEKI